MNKIKRFNDEENFINHSSLSDISTTSPVDSSVPVVDEPIVNPEPEPTELTPSIEDNPVVIGGEGEGLDGNCPDCECKEPNPEAPVYCNIDDLTIGTFFGTLMESIQIAWRYHLNATKHSTHVILEEYYSDAQDMIDTIIECYQSKFGIINITEYASRIVDFDKSCLCYFQELRWFVENGKSVLPEINCSSEILSEIDTLITKIDTTIYKLKNLTESKTTPFKSFEEFIND